MNLKLVQMFINQVAEGLKIDSQKKYLSYSVTVRFRNFVVVSLVFEKWSTEIVISGSRYSDDNY